MKWRDLATEAISAKDYSQMDAILFYANITHVDYLNDEIDNMSDALRAFEAYNKATTWREGADVPEGLRDAL